MTDPPDATISTDTAKWFIGLENAELMCSTGGQPRPQNITWTWYSPLFILSSDYSAYCTYRY